MLNLGLWRIPRKGLPYPGEYPTLAIRIPAGEHESPSIEISRAMCQELIEHVIKSERQRMSGVPGIGGHLDMTMH